MKRNSKGFTLIELLIVVAIIGIIVAIAIPNLLNAIQRAKQRRTMGDIRSAATAVEAYAVDLNRYPPAAGNYDLPFAITVVTAGANMSKYVSPTYIKSIPLADGWNSWFIYTADANGTGYIFASGGKDGTVTAVATGAPVGPTTDFNADIIYSNGSFMQWPEGVQR